MSSPRFCPNCGRPVPPENSFCAWCGYQMPPVSPAAAPPGTVPPAAAAPAGVAPPPPLGGMPPGYPVAPYMMAPKVDTGSLLSGTFDVWTKNFLSFFLVYFVLSLVTGILGALGAWALFGVPLAGGSTLVPSAPVSANPFALLAYIIVVALIGWLFASIVLGGVVDFSVRRYRGENVRIQDSLTKGVGRVFSIMGANLLVTLITLAIFGLWALLFVVGIFTSVTTGSFAGVVAAVCGALIALPFIAVLVVYISIALCLYAPVIMTEGAHAVDSLQRSWGLTKGRKWPIFWAGLVVFILSGILTAAISAVGGLTGNLIIELVLAALASAITGAWIAILTAVAYDRIVKQPQPSMWPPTTMPPAYPPR